MTTHSQQLALFAAPEPPPAEETSVTKPAPPPSPRGHRYERTNSGKIVCKRCTVERQHMSTGLRSGFQWHWRVLVNGEWQWVTSCPPCVRVSKPVASRSPRGRRQGSLSLAPSGQETP